MRILVTGGAGFIGSQIKLPSLWTGEGLGEGEDGKTLRILGTSKML